MKKKRTKWTPAREDTLKRNFVAVLGDLRKNAPDLLPLFTRALKLALDNDLKQSSAVFKKLRTEYFQRQRARRRAA